MSLPAFQPNNGGSIENSVLQILSSIAMEELALSHILNAEGEKLQYALGTLDGVSPPFSPTIDEIIEINQSVKDMVQQVGLTQRLLLLKMQEALKIYEKDGDEPPPPLPLFLLSYDTNGGHIDGPAPEIILYPRQGHPLNMRDIPSHGGHNSRPVAFIGWTQGQDTHFYEATDSLPSVITTIDIVDQDVTVYAVWGYDDNGNGIPDILEGEFTLTYDTNGGHDDGPPMVFNLVSNTSHAISTIIPTHDADVNGDEIIFIGWTEQQDTTIYSGHDQSSALPPLLTSVAIEDDNVTVFALWGYDQNNNGIPDVYEDTFDLNYDTNGGNNDGPPTETLLLPNHYQLDSTTIPSHAADNGKDVVFIGWSLEPTPIYAGVDDKNEVASKLVTDIDIVDTDVTVYAVWGYDEDGDNIPDILENMYTLTYDVNGGRNDGPASKLMVAQSDFLLNNTVTPTHAAVSGRTIRFLGWTDARDTTVYERSASIPSTITTVDIHADKTVYALWGYANLPGLEATAALCTSVNAIDGRAWHLARKAKIGSNTYLMLVAKGVISYGAFGANNTYEGSLVQASMTNACASSTDLRQIAVIPNLGNPSYQIPTTTEPTAVMADSQTKDVFFALSRQDALDGKISCNWGFADHWWARTAVSGTDNQAWEWNPNADTVNTSIVATGSVVGYLPAVWVRVY